MSDDIAEHVAHAYQRTHAHLLESVVDLADQELGWTAAPGTPSVGFHLWHVARWSDFLHEVLSGVGGQLWDSEGLALAWGLDDAGLGYAATGMGMDDDASARLALPPKALLLGYVRKTFSVADEAVGFLDERGMQMVYSGSRAAEYYGGEYPFSYNVLRELRHQNRHLGMIECLRGIMGLR